MSGEETFRAPWWLPGGHAQTIYAALAAPRPRVEYRRERWDTPDGDFIDIDWLERTHKAAQPLVVLFHGLEGCSRSHYALSLMHALNQRGWRGAVVHFRGCSGEPNRLLRAYHSGDSAEIDWILRRMHARAAGHMLFAAGVSLGGNALLKWAGEQGARADTLIHALAGVSVPMNLAAAGDQLARGFNRVYTRWFMRSLKPKVEQKYEQYRPATKIESALRANTMREYDDAYTAPVHGFRDAQDYWDRSSAQHLLERIATPTLILHARNDPFLPEHLLGTPRVSRAIEFEMSDTGGHVGFVSGAFPGRLDWLPQRVLRFFDAHAARARPASESAILTPSQ
jgi:uncharacterized protein